MFDQLDPERFFRILLVFGPVVFMTLFHVVNPIGSGILFLNITPLATDEMRHKVARKIAVNSFVVLLITMTAGVYLLALFGITVPIVQVCGGMLILAMGWRALNRKEDQPDTEDKMYISKEVKNERIYESQVFYPFTFPFTVGPGSIAVALTISAESKSGKPGSVIPMFTAAVLAIFLICVTIFICYAYAGRIVSKLSHQMRQMIMKLFSFVLLCIGGQIIWQGIVQLVETFK